MMQVLFHYTSQKGFEGIVREDGIHLWFSDALYLNDSNEIIGAKKYFDIAAEQLLEQGEIDNSILKTVKDMKYEAGQIDNIQFVRSGQSEINIQYEVAYYDKYVCCFSEKADSLPMWNYYLKNDSDGFAVGLDFNGCTFEHCKICGNVVDESCFNISTNMLQMIYDENTKIDYFKKDIRLYARALKESPESKAFHDVTFYNAFELLSNRCKDHHFEYENETRMLATVKDSGKSFIDGKKRDDIKYRFNYGLAIPYFELLIPHKEILKAVTISPKIGLNTENKDAITAMKKYLHNMGYNHEIEIKCSEIPLRY